MIVVAERHSLHSWAICAFCYNQSIIWSSLAILFVNNLLTDGWFWFSKDVWNGLQTTVFTEFSLILLSQVILYETTWNISLMFEQNIFLRVCWFMLWVQVTSVSSCQWSDSSLSPCEWLTISYYWKRNILGIHCGQCGYVLFWLEFVKIFNK